MSILAKITGESFESIERRFENKGYGEFKKEVADVVCNLLDKIQKRFKEYNDRELLDNILNKGAIDASVVADGTLKRTTKALGLN
jgi:tryptophanyl-tRNA synthetase